MLNAIGWGILAVLGSYFLLVILLATLIVMGDENKKDETMYFAKFIHMISLLIGLAVFLIAL